VKQDGLTAIVHDKMRKAFGESKKQFQAICSVAGRLLHRLLE
jgi:hypothetical protein